MSHDTSLHVLRSDDAIGHQKRLLYPTNRMTKSRSNPLAPHGTTVGLLFSKLKSDIENGVYAPGQRLVESELIKQYGVSRGPLREAFRALSAEGIIDFIPNKGAVVKKFSLKEISDIFVIRQVIEGLAARLATENLAKENHDDARRFLTIIRDQAFEPGHNFAQENSEFHNFILDLCDNPQLQVLTQQMRLPFLRFQIRGFLDTRYIQSSRQEHAQIARAMLEGDGKRAEQLMQSHLGQAAERFTSLPEVFMTR